MEKISKIIFPLLFIGILVWFIYSLIGLFSGGINLASFNVTAKVFALFYTILLASLSWKHAKRNVFYYLFTLSSLVVIGSIHLQGSTPVLLWKVEIGILLFFSVFSLSNLMAQPSLTLKIVLYFTAGLLLLPMVGYSSNIILILGGILCAVISIWSISKLIKHRN